MSFLLPLSLLAYLSPPLLGFAVYLAVFREPRPIEGLAFAWGMGGILVHVPLMVANQLLFIPFATEWILVTAIGFAASASILLVRFRGRLLRWWSRTRASAVGLARSPATLLLLVGPVLLLLFVLVKAVTYPETGPDSIFYHLFLAQDAFETGQLPRTSGLGWLEMTHAFPNLVVTQQIWIYYTAGSAAQVLSHPLVPIYAILLAALLVETGNRLRPGAGPVALLLLASFTIPAAVLPDVTSTLLPFGRLAVEIWTDIPVTFYALLAVHFILAGLRRPSVPVWAAAGLFAGGAALTKYNGLAFVAVVAALVILYALVMRLRPAGSDRSRISALHLGSFLIPLALLVGLLFLRNATLFGNPVYPFYTDIFGGINLRSAEILTDFAPINIGAVKAEQAFVVLSSLLFLLFLPSLTLRGPRYRLLQVTAAVYVTYILLQWSFLTAFYRMILPALPLVALSAGAWLHQAILPVGKALAAVLAVVAALVSFALQPGLPLAIAAATIAGVAVLFAPHVRRRWASGRLYRASLGGLLLVLSLTLSTPAMQAVAVAKYPTPIWGPFPTGLPLVGEDEVLQRAFGAEWELWQWMNDNLPPESRVMTLHPGRYYPEAQLVCPASLALVSHYDASSLGEALGVLRAADISYVLDTAATRVYVLTEPFWEQSPIFQNLDNTTSFEVVYQDSLHFLYRIRG